MHRTVFDLVHRVGATELVCEEGLDDIGPEFFQRHLVEQCVRLSLALVAGARRLGVVASNDKLGRLCGYVKSSFEVLERLSTLQCDGRLLGDGRFAEVHSVVLFNEHFVAVESRTSAQKLQIRQVVLQNVFKFHAGVVDSTRLEPSVFDHLLGNPPIGGFDLIRRLLPHARIAPAVKPVIERAAENGQQHGPSTRELEFSANDLARDNHGTFAILPTQLDANLLALCEAIVSAEFQIVVREGDAKRADEIDVGVNNHTENLCVL